MQMPDMAKWIIEFKTMIICCADMWLAKLKILEALWDLMPSPIDNECVVPTPFENPQRWMGQNTFPILLLNDHNMIGEH